MALQDKLKLQVYRKSKWEIGFEEYLEYVKGVPRLYFKFLSGTHGLFEELGRRDNGVVHRSVLIVGRAGKESLEHVLFQCASYDSQGQDF